MLNNYRVGDRIREAREKAGYSSRAEFARALGVLPSNYRKYESGEHQLPPAVAVRIGHLCHVDLTWLYLGESKAA